MDKKLSFLRQESRGFTVHSYFKGVGSSENSINSTITVTIALLTVSLFVLNKYYIICLLSHNHTQQQHNLTLKNYTLNKHSFTITTYKLTSTGILLTVTAIHMFTNLHSHRHARGLGAYPYYSLNVVSIHSDTFCYRASCK